jgi:hypothetical protein
MKNEELTKNDAIDKIDGIASKLEFVSDSIYIWNTDALDFNSSHKNGFIIIMEDIIKEIKECSSILSKQ